MPEKYRVGIAGCGGISRTHARGWLALGNCELAAGSDISSQSLDKFSSEFPISGKYSDYKEMLKKEKLDILSVCTWPGTHAEIAILAAEVGLKGILCEKPMCLNLGEAEAMIEACHKSGTKLAIGHHSRFMPANTEAKSLIKSGAIGKPTLLWTRVEGGVLNNGTHAIDRMRYLLSDPETEWVIGQVERKTDRYERAHRVEDLCAAIICFKGGTRGIIESDIPKSEAADGYFVYGTEGALSIGNELRLQNRDQAGWQIIPAKAEASQFAEMLSWVEGKSGHRNDAKQTRYTVEILMSIYESLRVKGLVKTPLQTKESPLIMMIEDETLPVIVPGKYDIRLR